MRHRQRGVTFLGWLILLIPVAVVVYAGIRLTPIYLNYMRVAKSLDRLTQQQQDDGTITAQSLRAALDRSFDIETIEYPTTKDIDIHRDGDHWVAVADYQDMAPLFGDLSLQVQFHKEVDLP
ncbi:MAG TPA: DUF4845 domain-containing protein [Steroidobacteraceae bacterium]|jgi:hypothetical protein|nr:DUF4845 domain-containing protein [Steroidobacteraceae bacterium]